MLNEMIAVIGISITAGTLIGKVASHLSSANARLEQRVIAIEQNFEESKIAMHAHLRRQDEKLDRLLELRYEMHHSQH